VRRLLVTAVAVTVQPGTSTQLAYGLLTAILSLLLYASVRPFSSHADNTLAILAASVLTLATFSGLLLSAEVTRDEGWSLLGVGTFLAICTASVVVLGFVLAFLQAKALLERLRVAADKGAKEVARRRSRSSSFAEAPAAAAAHKYRVGELEAAPPATP